MTLETGTTLGPYKILDPLGAGGMGEVYRARDTRLDRDVAVKVVSAGAEVDAAALSRFEREAKAVAALSHPNILALHDYGVDRGTAYSVTELLEGEDLRARITRGAIPPRKAIDCALQIARGLAAAHAGGIIHRDLKPENVFLTKDGQVKILDFGLARIRRDEGAREPPPGATTSGPTAAPATSPGMILGTVGYMAPEQVRGEPADHRSDIFAFGAVLHEMLTGTRAFQGASAVETLHAILKEDAADLAAGGREIPPGLVRIVEHCLEKQPADRFQSARDLVFALESLPASSGSQLAAAAAGAARGPGRVLRTHRFAIVAVLLAVLAAAWGGALLDRRAVQRRAAPPRTFRPLTYQPLIIFNARYAPDGRTVIFSASREGVDPEIYAIGPEYPEPRPLGLPHTHLLSVSSRGELAVLTHPQNQGWRIFEGTLAVVTLGGSAPRPLIEKVREADWSPDGSQMAVIRFTEGVDRLEYPIGTVLYQSSGYVSDLRISPRGDQIAFFDHPHKWDNRGAVLVVDRQGKHRSIADGFWGLEGLAWSADGRSILFSGSRVGWILEVWIADPRGGATVALPSPAALFVFDTRRDGQWLLARVDQWLGILARCAGAEEIRELGWLDSAFPVCLSPDGNFLLFNDQSMPAGSNYAVCLQRTDGSPVLRLGEGLACDLSPDQSRALAILKSPAERVVTYPTGAGELRMLNTEGLSSIADARWSRDGARVFIAGSESGNTNRVYALDPAGGAPKAITPEGRILGISPNGSAIMQDEAGDTLLVRASGDAPRPVVGLGASDRLTKHWSRDDGSILVYKQDHLSLSIEWLNLATGARTPFATLSLKDRVGFMEAADVVVSEDERSIAWSVTEQRDLLITSDPAQGAERP